MSVTLIIKLLTLITLCPHPIKVNSGLRTPSKNRAVGGANQSYHLTGEAVDISIRGLSTKTKECLIREGKGLFTGVGVYPNHLHLDIREKKFYWEVK